MNIATNIITDIGSTTTCTDGIDSEIRDICRDWLINVSCRFFLLLLLEESDDNDDDDDDFIIDPLIFKKNV